ncbi:MAG: hypothetical protein ACI4KF_06320 [Huintestinicola sp.]
MKKLLQLAASAAAGFVLAAVLSVTASAEDYEFDVSDAVESSSWGQSVTHYTCLGDTSLVDNFDPTWMTPESEVIIEFETESDAASSAPCELIWQTWGDRPAEVARDWNKIVPYEYDTTHAVFSYDDIVAKYGTDDFSTVYAINVGDTGEKLKVTSMKITNCDIPEAPAEEETAAEETAEAETTAKETTARTTEKVTEKETEAQTEATTLAVPAYEEEDEGSSTMIILIIVIAVVVAAAVVLVVLILKKAKNKYY